jgi:glycolate oxidase FAD binding subunit
VSKAEATCPFERELCDRVQTAARNGSTLHIRGASSKSSLFPDSRTETESGGEASIEMTAHRGILAYDPAELVLTARAGTPIAEIAEAVAAHGQCLPFEPLQGSGATLGGTVACNLSGPARPWRGAVRDAVLGLRIINGRGEALGFGGVVMKNVAGYDLSRLQCGALGTLGIITQVSIRLLPAPAAETHWRLPIPAAEAISLMRELAIRPLPLTGAAWIEGALFLRLAGGEEALRAAAKVLPADADAIAPQNAPWAALREFTGPQLGARPVWCLSLAPATTLGEESPLCIDWAGARRFYAGSSNRDILEALARRGRGALRQLGGDAVLPVATLKQLRALRKAFDPDGLFNPGIMPEEQPAAC